MKICRVSFTIRSERKKCQYLESSIDLIVNNKVFEELNDNGNALSKTILNNITELAATLETGDILAKTAILELEEISYANS